MREEQSGFEAKMLKKQQEMEREMGLQMQKRVKEAESRYQLKVNLDGQQKLQDDTERLRGRFEAEVAERVTVETARFVENFKMEASRAMQPRGESSAGNHDPISRPQTSLSHVDPFMQSVNTSTSPNEDSLTTANTSLGSLSIQTSPKAGSIFEKKEKLLPIPKRQREAYCRSKTSFESPGDIHMSDPSPMSISSLNLSPRRTVPAPPTHFPRGNIFAEAEAARQKWEPRLAYTTDDEEDDDDVLDFLNSDSPIRPKPIKLTSDPMKPPPPQLRPGRPGMIRQHTSAAVMQTLSNKPALLPSKRSKAANVRAALAAGLKPPSAEIARSATESNLNAIQVSPPRNRRVSKIPSSANLKADAATSPKRGLTSKLVPKGMNRNPDATGTGGDEMLKAVHARNLGGKTLVELSQERQMRGMVAEGDRDLCAPVWDPEVCGDECMPSPFLKRDVRNVLGLANGNVVRGLR